MSRCKWGCNHCTQDNAFVPLPYRCQIVYFHFIHTLFLHWLKWFLLMVQTEEVSHGFFSVSLTHVSGEILSWPSTIRHSELERIIHSSIISFPLCGPLLFDLLAFLAFPQLQPFIPAAAAICISPAIVARWLQEKKKKDEIGTVQSEIRSAQVTVVTQRGKR